MGRPGEASLQLEEGGLLAEEPGLQLEEGGLLGEGSGLQLEEAGLLGEESGLQVEEAGLLVRSVDPTAPAFASLQSAPASCVTVWPA